ncbi:MAG: helix-turn-helix domain-containing protein [Candidatus Omnitrophica bacterium]|nr:helix-turn-helix domain-containing protein [Candidatus Omnitrophota bacterium]
MNTPESTVGLKLKELRLLKEWSLRDVEKATQNMVSNAYLSQIESGKIKQPSPHILNHLAEVYEVDYKDLLTTAGYIKPAIGEKKGRGHGIAFFNQQDVTEEEKRELLDYLQFIRAKKGKYKHEKE